MHAQAKDAHSTDWPQIAALYRVLERLEPTPVVRLSLAVAIAMADGPEQGLSLIDEIPGLENYHLYHSARADLLRRLGRNSEAAEAYRNAISRAANQVEVAYLTARLDALKS